MIVAPVAQSGTAALGLINGCRRRTVNSERIIAGGVDPHLNRFVEIRAGIRLDDFEQDRFGRQSLGRNTKYFAGKFAPRLFPQTHYRLKDADRPLTGHNCLNVIVGQEAIRKCERVRHRLSMMP